MGWGGLTIDIPFDAPPLRCWQFGISRYRFSSVKVDSSRGQLTIGLRGKAGEPVPLLFAIRGDAGGYTCVSKTATVGPDGTGSFSYSKGE